MWHTNQWDTFISQPPPKSRHKLIATLTHIKRAYIQTHTYSRTLATQRTHCTCIHAVYHIGTYDALSLSHSGIFH